MEKLKIKHWREDSGGYWLRGDGKARVLKDGSMWVIVDRSGHKIENNAGNVRKFNEIESAISAYDSEFPVK